MRISATNKVDVMSKNNLPAAYCKLSDTVVFETNDCFDNSIMYDGSLRNDKKYLVNPATGPVYIEGVKKGDTLCVEIKDIKINNYGIIKTHFGDGVFANIHRDNGCQVVDIEDGYIHFKGKRIPLNVMIGVIGIAPSNEKIPTVSAGMQGGNLDCIQVKEGVKVYFPVAVDGALFAIGDLHAVMGDGEVCGYGLEVQGEVTVRFSVIQGKSIDAPVIYDGEKIMVLASERTLDSATQKVNETLFKILVSNGWDEIDAAILMSLQANLSICQVVNPVKTVRMSISADLIKKD